MDINLQIGISNMFKRVLHIYLTSISALLFFLFCSSAVTVSAEQQLGFHDQIFSDDKIQITFEVDSTWVLVRGNISGVNGNYSVDSGKDYPTVTGKIKIPVENFKTGSESRDEHMREVMAADKFKDVSVSIEGFNVICTPWQLGVVDQSCSGSLNAKLEIRDVTKAVQLPYTLAKKTDKDFVASGEIQLNWAEYNVEDPSILIAKLDPVVKVLYSIKLSAK
jgi:polyisoprenoid-binding protein YceI